MGKFRLTTTGIAPVILVVAAGAARARGPVIGASDRKQPAAYLAFAEHSSQTR